MKPIEFAGAAAPASAGEGNTNVRARHATMVASTTLMRCIPASNESDFAAGVPLRARTGFVPRRGATSGTGEPRSPASGSAPNLTVTARPVAVNNLLQDDRDAQ